MQDATKKYGVFSAVGKQSLHRNWIYPIHNFDLHLIIYDKSAIDFNNDTPYITTGHGYKFKLIYKYLIENPKFLEIYDYYYMPDDDILIDSSNISKLFEYMEKYNLNIAQPALYDSYYTFKHTIREKYSILRFTNFVEIMQPCFSREALNKVLFTFNENESGWGIDYHWGEIIGSNKYDMAIIDDVKSVHTRPVCSYNPQNKEDLDEYLKKHELNTEVNVYNLIPQKSDVIISSSCNPLLSFDEFKKNDFCLERIAYTLITNIDSIKPIGLYEGTLGVSLFFFEYYRISGEKKHEDLAYFFLKRSICDLSIIKNDFSLSSGLIGVIWTFEYLLQHNYINVNTDEVLENVLKYTHSSLIRKNSVLNIKDGLTGYGLQLLKKIEKLNLLENKSDINKEINILINILGLLKTTNVDNLSYNTVIDIVFFLNQFSFLNIKNIIVLDTLNIYSNVLFNNYEIEKSLISSTNFYILIKSIVVLYNSSITLNDNDLKNVAIEGAIEIMNKITLKNIDTSLKTAFLYNYLGYLTDNYLFKSFSLKLLKDVISDLNKYFFIQQNQTEKTNTYLKPQLAWIGLMIMSFLTYHESKIELLFF